MGARAARAAFRLFAGWVRDSRSRGRSALRLFGLDTSAETRASFSNLLVAVCRSEIRKWGPFDSLSGWLLRDVVKNPRGVARWRELLIRSFKQPGTFSV